MTANEKRAFEYRVGDEVSFAMHNGMLYGEVVKVVTPGENGAIEIEFEDGRREVKKVKDRGLRLVRRRSGVTEADEQRGPRERRQFDSDIRDTFRSDQKKR